MESLERGGGRDLVAEFMQRVAELDAPAMSPSDPVRLWCRARLLYRDPGDRRVLRFLAVSEGLELAACAVAAVALFRASWSALSLLSLP